MRKLTLVVSIAFLCLAFATLASAVEGGDDVVKWHEITAGSSRIQFYGFLRLDTVADDSRPNNFQSIGWILSEDPSVGLENAQNFTIYARLSRFGMNFLGPEVSALGGARLSGNLETDFQNGGSESRPNIRIRHAFFKLSWKTVSFLGGQTWDVISPLFPAVNNDSLMWNAGNVGDRRPQLRFSWDPKMSGGTFSLTGAAGLTGAVDEKDLDDDGVRDGEASGRPNVQLRAGWARAIDGDESRKMSFGVWGHRGWEKTSTASISGQDSFNTRSVGIDVKVPILKWFGFQGEAWTGANLSDFRGTSGQGINPASGQEIEGDGAWMELSFKVGSSLSFYPGFTIDDPRDSDVPAQGRTQNGAWYLATRYQPNPSFLMGLDYLHWTTEYEGLQDGTDNRFNLIFQYTF